MYLLLFSICNKESTCNGASHAVNASSDLDWSQALMRNLSVPQILSEMKTTGTKSRVRLASCMRAVVLGRLGGPPGRGGSEDEATSFFCSRKGKNNENKMR